MLFDKRMRIHRRDHIDGVQGAIHCASSLSQSVFTGISPYELGEGRHQCGPHDVSLLFGETR